MDSSKRAKGIPEGDPVPLEAGKNVVITGGKYVNCFARVKCISQGGSRYTVVVLDDELDIRKRIDGSLMTCSLTRGALAILEEGDPSSQRLRIMAMQARSPAKPKVRTIYYTLCTIYCIVYTVYLLYTVYCIPIYYVLYTIYYTMYCILYTIYQYTIYHITHNI
jgi:hypothetical protein